MVQGNRVGSWVVVVSMLLASSLVSIAQQNPPPQSIDQVLNPDGSLRLGKGIQGSFRADGYKLELGPNGEPRFRDASPQSTTADTADVHWDNRFACPTGFDGPVRAIYVDGDTVYFGGYFTAVGSTAANCIVKWDGVSWTPLGSGVVGFVHAIAKFRGEIYAGGYLTRAGGVQVRCIAKWNGSSWFPLGVPPNDGVPGEVRALLSMGDSLYIAGKFDWSPADTMKVNGLAIWDGSSIIPMPGNQVYPYEIQCLASDGKNLYVGAYWFSIKSGASWLYVRDVLRWDRNSWGILGASVQNGLRGYANAMVWVNGSLFAGGSFDSAGTVSANNIARWNGASWVSLGPGLNGEVNALSFSEGKLFAGGNFTSSGVKVTNAVASYDTSLGTWNSVSANVAPPPSYPLALAFRGTVLLMGGTFEYWSDSYQSGSDASYYAASWDGGTLTPLGVLSPADGVHGFGSGTGIWDWMPQEVNAFAVDGDRLYVAGNFATVGPVRASNIACWNNSSKTWSSLGEGVDGPVITLALDGTNLYAGGAFQNAGGAPARSIARWDGASWHPLGTPPDDGVHYLAFALCVFSGNLYVGGSFTTAGGVIANNIARWDGNTWWPLGAGTTGNVFSLAVFNDELFAGGQLTAAGLATVNNLAKWDGVSWKAVGNPPDDGANGVVYALHNSGGYLYAGGSFSKVGTTNANCIARWNGTSWSSLGPGVNAAVRTLASSGRSVYAGGEFTATGVRTVNHVARWDTGSATWGALGSGTDAKVFAMNVIGNDLFLGGPFVTAGGKPSSRFARWNSGYIASGVDGKNVVPAGFELSQNYPNPFNPTTSIAYTVGGVGGQGSGVSDVRLVVYDILGREVATLVNERKAPGTYSVRFDASGLASGVYLYRLTAGRYVESRKMVLMK